MSCKINYWDTGEYSGIRGGRWRKLKTLEWQFTACIRGSSQRVVWGEHKADLDLLALLAPRPRQSLIVLACGVFASGDALIVTGLH